MRRGPRENWAALSARVAKSIASRSVTCANSGVTTRRVTVSQTPTRQRCATALAATHLRIAPLRLPLTCSSPHAALPRWRLLTSLPRRRARLARAARLPGCTASASPCLPATSPTWRRVRSPKLRVQQPSRPHPRGRSPVPLLCSMRGPDQGCQGEAPPRQGPRAHAHQGAAHHYAQVPLRRRCVPPATRGCSRRRCKARTLGFDTVLLLPPRLCG